MNWQMRRLCVVLTGLLIVVAYALLLVWSWDDSPHQAPVQSASAPHATDRSTEYQTSRSYVRPSPAPTVKTTPKPKNTPKENVPAPKKTQKPQAPTTANVTLACIRHHESRGNYGVVSEVRNGVTYQGAYQLSSKYTYAWATRYGHSNWAGKPAHTWPASVQDDVALKLGRETSPDWVMWSSFTSYSCPGF
jgi:hypothetical protein